jgi:hypothetical protein
MTFPIEPQPHQPVQSPMIYISERPSWEYKRLVRDLTKGQPPSVKQLTALGRQGWELVAAVSRETQVYFYFKRLR